MGNVSKLSRNVSKLSREDKARNDLKKYAVNKEYMLKTKEKIASIREKIQSPSGQRITGMPSSHKSRDLSDYMAELEELQKSITLYEKIMDAKKEKIRKIPNEITVKYLELKYVNEFTMSEIGDAIGKSTSWAKKYHKIALGQYADANGIL